MATTVTSQIQGITINEAIKAPVAAVATNNLTLSGYQTVGGVTITSSSENKRTLAWMQTDPIENGIYDQDSSGWRRSKDFDGNRDVVQGTLVLTNDPDVAYRVTTADPIVIGSSSIIFEVAGLVLSQSAFNALLATSDLFKRTAAEIAASVTPTNYAFEPGNAKRYGASSANSNAQNKTALQAAIAANGRTGGSPVVVPADINYGYDVNDLSTHPDFSGCTAPITVIDYGPGASFAGFPTAYDGAQIRTFFHTPQTTSLGQHMGNTEYIRASWNPGIFIVNDANLAAVGNPARLASDNRRAQLSFGNDGEELWKIGQGTLAGAGYTDEELSNFALQHVQATGDTLTSYGAWIVERETGNQSFGFATNAPPASFHFNSRVTGFYQAMFENSFGTESSFLMRNSVGLTDDCGLANKAGALSLFIRSQGDALIVDKLTRRITFAKGILEHIVALTYGTAVGIDSSESTIFTLNATNGTAFAINAPTNATTGGRFQITIKNTSGGVLGTVTWNAVFKVSSWTSPANGFQRSIAFYYDGTNWIQTFVGVDVPN